MERLKQSIDNLSAQVASLCLGDTPDLDVILNTLNEIEALSANLDAAILHTVTGAYKSYVKKLLSKETTDITPLEKGLTLIHALLRHIEKDMDFIFDISDVLKILDTSFFDPAPPSAQPSAPHHPGRGSMILPKRAPESPQLSQLQNNLKRHNLSPLTTMICRFWVTLLLRQRRILRPLKLNSLNWNRIPPIRIS